MRNLSRNLKLKYLKNFKISKRIELKRKETYLKKFRQGTIALLRSFLQTKATTLRWISGASV